MSAEDAAADFVLDLTDWDGVVPVQMVEDDAELRRVEWAAQLALVEEDDRVEPPVRLSAMATVEPVWDDNADAVEHARAVQQAVKLIRIREDARRAYAAERTPPEDFDAGTLADILARAPEPAARIEGLLPWQAGMLLIAPRKAGKTTISLGGIARSLITGDDFLGAMKVRPIEPEARFGILNFEVSGATLARWGSEAAVPADRLFIVNLRGKRNPFKSDADLERLGKLLREQRVESLLVDPFGRAFDGDDPNSNGQVQSWLDRLDHFARETAGALDVILTAHAGHVAEHVRGASSLEGWADVNVTMTRQGDTRYLSAEGRDVELTESALGYDAATRQLTLVGGSRAATGQGADLDLIEHLLRDAAVPMSGRAIEQAVAGMVGEKAVAAALKCGEREGRLGWQKGAKGAHDWFVIELPQFVNGGEDDLD